MKLISFSRGVLAWPLAWLGVLLCIPMMRWDWGWTYGIYNQLMIWSAAIQGEQDFGPWKRTNKINKEV